MKNDEKKRIISSTMSPSLPSTIPQSIFIFFYKSTLSIVKSWRGWKIFSFFAHSSNKRNVKNSTISVLSVKMSPKQTEKKTEFAQKDNKKAHGVASLRVFFRQKIRFSLKFFCLSLFSLTIFFDLLTALEIRLNAPKKLYTQKKMLLADMETSNNLLEEATTQNFDDGIAITITYYIEFYKEGWLWDTKITERQIIKKIRKDIWSKRFFIDEANETKMFSDKKKLDNALQSISKVPIIPTKSIDSQDNYYFKTRIAIKIKNYSSFYLLVNNIISLLKYRTTYVESKRYLGKELGI